MYIHHDPDEWETVTSSRPSTTPPDSPIQNGSLSIGMRRRAPEEVARIKATKRRQHEDAVLAEAAAIKARRRAKP